MHPSRAAPRPAGRPARHVRHAYRLLATALLALGGATLAAPFTLVQSQQTPAIQLGAYRYEVGDTLLMRATGLAPNGEYQFSLQGPGGEVSERSVVSGPAGGLEVEAVLDEPGTWSVGLNGERMSARLNVEVVGDEPATASPAAPGPAGEVQAPPTVTEPAPEQTPDQELGAQAPPTDDAPEDAPEVPPSDPGAQSEQEGPPRGPVDAEPGENELPGEMDVPPAVQRQEIQVDLVQGDVVGRRNEVEAWRLTFPPGSGLTAGLLERDEVVLVGHGNHLLQVDRLTGMVLSRDRLPAQVVDVGQVGSEIVASVEYASGDTVDLSWPPPTPLAFDPDPELYRWLRAEADVEAPATRLAQDPTNPWLYVAAARERPDQSETLLRGAFSQARTFYEYAQLAGSFMGGQPRQEELAAQAMYEALQDFVERGYRGSLLLDPQLTAAYGFPQPRLAAALEADDREAASFWAPWVYRLGSSGSEATRLLNDYAALLDADGDDEAAQDWRARAAAGGGSDARTTVERAAAAVGATGWYGVTALLVAVVALHLTLAAKYWRAQTLVMRQRLESGRSNGRLARLFGLRYATFTEKLVIVMLFAAMVAVAALGGWVGSSGARPAALGAGALSTPTSRALLAEAPDNADTMFVRGYAAQTAGDLERASELYRDLSSDADAMNNLGVIRGDPELFRLALELEPTHGEAAFNLGETSNPSRLMQAYRPQEPLLTAPDEGRLARAFSGGPWSSLSDAFTNPFVELRDLGVEPAWLWTAIVVLFLAWVAWTVLTIFFPRPAAARNAPRTFLYHLLALLLPGSGLADELWGVLLLVPWAIFGIDLVSHLVPMGVAPGIPFNTDVIALVAIYVVNTVAFFVEFASYRRRMRDLRAERPEVAAAYGPRP